MSNSGDAEAEGETSGPSGSFSLVNYQNPEIVQLEVDITGLDYHFQQNNTTSSLKFFGFH